MKKNKQFEREQKLEKIIEFLNWEKRGPAEKHITWQQWSYIKFLRIKNKKKQQEKLNIQEELKNQRHYNARIKDEIYELQQQEYINKKIKKIYFGKKDKRNGRKHKINR